VLDKPHLPTKKQSSLKECSKKLGNKEIQMGISSSCTRWFTQWQIRRHIRRCIQRRIGCRQVHRSKGKRGHVDVDDSFGDNTHGCNGGCCRRRIQGKIRSHIRWHIRWHIRAINDTTTTEDVATLTTTRRWLLPVCFLVPSLHNGVILLSLL
jgi:hypothetical protein